MGKGYTRAILLVSQIGISMLVPIVGAAYLGIYLFKGNLLATIILMILGTIVGIRNLFVILIKESRRKSPKRTDTKGRPSGYTDPEEED